MGLLLSFQGSGDVIVVSGPDGNDMEVIVPDSISAGDTFLVYAEEQGPEEAAQDFMRAESEAEAIRLEVETGIAAVGEKMAAAEHKKQTSRDPSTRDDIAAQFLSSADRDSGEQMTVASGGDAEQQVTTEEAARARALVAQTEVAAAAADEATFQAQAAAAAKSAAKAARDERAALERVAALEAELNVDAEMCPDASSRNSDDNGSIDERREQQGESGHEDEELLVLAGNAGTSATRTVAGAEAVSGLLHVSENDLTETGSPSGWGSPRRQVITHEDDWEAVIALNGHTYTADKRSGCVFFVPRNDDFEGLGAGRVEVGRWDPVQTLIVFNDAAAELERLRGLARRSGTVDANDNDIYEGAAPPMSDSSPRSIAAAVRRKQRQNEQAGNKSPTSGGRHTGGSGSGDTKSKQLSAHAGSEVSPSQQAGRVASWAGPPQQILTEEEGDLIVEVLEEVYLVDLVRLSLFHLCFSTQ